MPAGLDEDYFAVRFEACVDVVVKPVEYFIADGLRLGLGAGFYRVVDDDEIGSKACNARTTPDRTDTAALARFPFGVGLDPSCRNAGTHARLGVHRCRDGAGKGARVPTLMGAFLRLGDADVASAAVVGGLCGRDLLR